MVNIVFILCSRKQMVPRTRRERTNAIGNGLGNEGFGPGTFCGSCRAGRRGHIPVLRQQRRRSDQRRHQTGRSRTAPSASNWTFSIMFLSLKNRTRPIRTLQFYRKKKNNVAAYLNCIWTKNSTHHSRKSVSFAFLIL